MNKKKRKETISITLYIKFIISIIIPTIIISIGYLYYFQNEQKQQNLREANNILSTAKMKVEQVILNMKEASAAPYISSDAFKALSLFINPSLEADQLRAREVERNYEEILYKVMFQSSLDIEALTFCPYEGNSCYVVSRVSQGVEIKDYDYTNEQWFLSVKESKNPFIFYSPNLPKYLKDSYYSSFDVLSIAINVKNTGTTKDLGVIIATIRASRINKILKSTIIDDNDNLILIDKNQIVSESNELNEAQLQTINEKNENNLFNKYHKYLLDIPNTNLELIYLSHNKKNHISLFYFYLICLAFLIAEIIIGFAIYRASSKEMVEDINNILSTMKEISKGNLDVQAKGSSFEYLQNFSTELNRMTKKLKKTIDDEYIAVINRQKAECRALQSQINPHFLYNTLNGFIGLNRMGEQKKLEKSIIALTKLFRYTCTQNDTVQLQYEIDFIKEYFKLQKIKYEERLNIIYEIDEESKKITIPKLILQPLVENAIVHGLEPISKPVTITIKSLISETESSKDLFISIKDDGIGCSSDKLHVNNSIALKNIENRIKLFSSGSVLAFKCKENEGVEVYIIIPLKG